MTITISHIALHTNNPERLTSFYTNKLGFKKEKESLAPKALMRKIFGFGSDCRLIMLSRGSTRLELISLARGRFKARSADKVGYGHWACVVKDKVRFCHAIEKKKVKVIKTTKNSRLICFIKDPDGNRIEVQDYK